MTYIYIFFEAGSRGKREGEKNDPSVAHAKMSIMEKKGVRKVHFFFEEWGKGRVADETRRKF